MRSVLAIPTMALVVSVLSLTAACSRESDTQASAPTTQTSALEGQTASGVGDPFAATAVAACQHALESKRAWTAFPVVGFDPSQPDPADFPVVAAWLESQVAPTFEAWLDGLTRLGAPPSGQEAWGDVLSAIDTIVDLNAQQVASAKTDDVDGFVEARDELAAIQPELERASEAAGVPTCADVHK